ncbi:DUF397 domain-containing protein [Actinomadura scrupuli]|uniref:DUF397 domain-containing protein n=1 Tax=Actinomadura scrupuli TaxID=559629 RepID=UPI003D963605
MTPNPPPVTEWSVSTASEGGNGCVEAATLDRHHLVRDSKHQSGPVLTFTRPKWTAFINGVKNSTFDLPPGRADTL